jgi:hypothetical protein
VPPPRRTEYALWTVALAACTAALLVSAAPWWTFLVLAVTTALFVFTERRPAAALKDSRTAITAQMFGGLGVRWRVGVCAVGLLAALATGNGPVVSFLVVAAAVAVAAVLVLQHWGAHLGG